MAKSKKQIEGAIEVTLENIQELCETIPTCRPTSEFAEKPGIVFNKPDNSEKSYVFVGESVVETEEGIWEKA